MLFKWTALIDREAGEIIHLVASVCLCVCMCVCVYACMSHLYCWKVHLCFHLTRLESILLRSRLLVKFLSRESMQENNSDCNGGNFLAQKLLDTTLEFVIGPSLILGSSITSYIEPGTTPEPVEAADNMRPCGLMESHRYKSRSCAYRTCSHAKNQVHRSNGSSRRGAKRHSNTFLKNIIYID